MLEKSFVPFHKPENISLNAKEIEATLEYVHDSRLHADEDIEHFTIHFPEKIVYVPKRKVIPFQKDSDSKIQYIPVEQYIKFFL